ncbi:hypothetical protein BX265_5028 [Streptomyces sp. TLI_235]|nr:hypothetical protein BX265_5028 [Streptomyces sp. TLI_235]
MPFDDLLSYFSGDGAGMAPHILWDPFTGRTAQFFPATSRAKAVKNLPGGVETNRKGDICIQIEILFFPHCRVNGQVYATVADTPCVGLDRLMAWLRSWGVPDVWPMGAPTWPPRRSVTTWNARSGHYGHSQVPENDHTDPGPMPNLFGTAAATTEEDYMETDRAEAWFGQLNAEIWGLKNDMAAAAQRDAAQTAAITQLAAAVAAQHGIDQAQLVQQIKQAIAEAVVKVDVSVGTTAPPAPGS